MASVNQCNFIGRLGRDPDMTYTPSGTPVTKFSLAVDEYVSKDNKTTLWLNVVCWQKLAENMFSLLHKGSEIFLTGRLAMRKYADKSGVERVSIEIIAASVQLLGPKQGNGAAPAKPATDEEFALDPDTDFP
jgi:single-strand DNA-binding protein